LDLASGNDLVFSELTSAGRWRYWAPGRNGIFFVDNRPEGNWLQFLNVESRKITRIREIGKLLDGPAGLAISPDERTVLFAQRDKDDRDIMLATLK
jgi:hypothetical protein